MTRRRRGLILTVAAGCSVVLAAAPAQGAGGDPMVCSVTGAMGFPPGLTLTHRTVAFEMQADVTCSSGLGDVAVGTLRSSGRVNSYACGNGFGFGDDQYGSTVIDFPAGSPVPDVEDLRYVFAVAGWQATIDVTGARTTDGGTGSGAGHLTLVPSDGGGCLQEGITGFDVVGELSLTFHRDL